MWKLILGYMVLELFHMQQITLNHHLGRARDMYIYIHKYKYIYYEIGEKEFNYQYFIDAHNS
jgi:hypothetical protein